MKLTSYDRGALVTMVVTAVVAALMGPLPAITFVLTIPTYLFMCAIFPSKS